MTRVPLTLRMLLLLPLLAAGIDLTRTTVVCGAQAQTCLEAAGRGWLGPVAALLVVVYGAAAGILVARAAQRRRGENAPPGFRRLWTLGTVGLVLTCTGQDAITRLVGDSTALGGSPLAMLALCVIGGALLALCMRVVTDATELVRDLAVAAPRLTLGEWAHVVVYGERPEPVLATVRGIARGRAPPR